MDTEVVYNYTRNWEEGACRRRYKEDMVDMGFGYERDSDLVEGFLEKWEDPDRSTGSECSVSGGEVDEDKDTSSSLDSADESRHVKDKKRNDLDGFAPRPMGFKAPR